MVKAHPTCGPSSAHTLQRPRCQGPAPPAPLPAPPAPLTPPPAPLTPLSPPLPHPSPRPLPLVASRSSIRGGPQVQGLTPSWLEPQGLLNVDRGAPSKAPGSHLLAAPTPGCPSGPPPTPTTDPMSIPKAQSGDTAHPGHTSGERQGPFHAAWPQSCPSTGVALGLCEPSQECSTHPPGTQVTPTAKNHQVPKVNGAQVKKACLEPWFWFPYVGKAEEPPGLCPEAVNSSNQPPVQSWRVRGQPGKGEPGWEQRGPSGRTPSPRWWERQPRAEHGGGSGKKGGAGHSEGGAHPCLGKAWASSQKHGSCY